MVYFANKTRNHARGFRIQKHLLAANESCVPITQNCCATDFRKTVIRFVACQAPHCIPPRKFGVPGRLALHLVIGERPARAACWHGCINGSDIMRQGTSRSSDSRRVVQTIWLSAYPPPSSPPAYKYPLRPPESSFPLVYFPLTGKAHYGALNKEGNHEEIED